MSRILTTIQNAIASQGEHKRLRSLWLDHDGQSVRTKAGQTITFEEEPADSAYLLTSGTVRSATAGGGITGLWRAPCLLGMRDLLFANLTQESLTCLTPCRLLVWTQEDVAKDYQSSPQLKGLLHESLARAYAYSIGFLSFMSLPLEERLVRVLAEHVRERDSDDPQGLPEYDELAGLCGCTKKSIGRALARLREQHIVLEQGERFSLDEAALLERRLGEQGPLFHSLAGGNSGGSPGAKSD